MDFGGAAAWRPARAGAVAPVPPRAVAKTRTEAAAKENFIGPGEGCARASRIGDSPRFDKGDRFPFPAGPRESSGATRRTAIPPGEPRENGNIAERELGPTSPAAIVAQARKGSAKTTAKAGQVGPRSRRGSGSSPSLRRRPAGRTPLGGRGR